MNLLEVRGQRVVLGGLQDLFHVRLALKDIDPWHAIFSLRLRLFVIHL